MGIRQWLCVMLLGFGLSMATQAQTLPHARDQPKAVTEVQRLKAENLKLRYALWQAQQRELQQAGEALERERVALEVEFRAALTPPDGSTFNWQTLSFDSPPPAVPATTGAAAPKSDDKELK